MYEKSSFAKYFREAHRDHGDLRGGDRPLEHGGDRAGKLLEQCSSSLLTDAVSGVLSRRGFIGFGATSDGGAVSCYVVRNGKRFRAHAGDVSTLEEILSAVIESIPPDWEHW